jgi:hypothetical protein
MHAAVVARRAAAAPARRRRDAAVRDDDSEPTQHESQECRLVSMHGLLRLLRLLIRAQLIR